MKKALLMTPLFLVGSMFFAQESYALHNNVREGSNLLHDRRSAYNYLAEVDALPKKTFFRYMVNRPYYLTYKDDYRIASPVRQYTVVRKYDTLADASNWLNGGRYMTASDYVSYPGINWRLRVQRSERNAERNQRIMQWWEVI